MADPLEMSATTKMDIAIAGGSIAGLCAGAALHAIGYDVHVFERSKNRLASRGAGIVVQPKLLDLLADVKAPQLSTTGCTLRRTIDGASGARQETHMPQRFTSWEAVYACLSSAFPSRRHHLGKSVENVAADDSGVDFSISGEAVRADILIAADGFRSSARARYAPGTVSRYAGYIAWRGVVDERALPADLVDFFDDAFSFCNVADGGHALCYFIPGDNLGAQKGDRRLNWVWYVTIDEGAALDRLMTDKRGEKRDASVPQGVVSDAALEDLKFRTVGLDSRFRDLVLATPKPFIQSIIDVAPPAMVFGRVCLLGDAAFVVRPHTAAAAAKAAADASALARALRSTAPDIDRGLSLWGRQQSMMGRQLVDYGVMLGERSRGTGAR